MSEAMFCLKHDTKFPCALCTADQLAWDRFAAAAMEHPANDGFDGYKIRAEWAACFADAMMEQRAKRLAGKLGEGK